MQISRVEVTVVFGDGSDDQTIVLESPISVELINGIIERLAEGKWREFEHDGTVSIAITGKRSKPVDPRREKIAGLLWGDSWNSV
jgi:hypothetical protein